MAKKNKNKEVVLKRSSIKNIMNKIKEAKAREAKFQVEKLKRQQQKFGEVYKKERVNLSAEELVKRTLAEKEIGEMLGRETIQLKKEGWTTESVSSNVRRLERAGLRTQLVGAQLASAFKRREGSKAIAKRAKAVKGTLTAMGIIQGKQTYAGAGRPRGSYIHGMPIHIYKKMLRDRKALYQRYQDEQNLRLQTRGFTREQLQQLQQQQAIQELQQPMQEEVQEQEMPQEYQGQQMPQQYQQTSQVIQQSQEQENYGRVLPRSQYPIPPPSVADDELRFRQWSAEKTISPRTQSILDRLRRIQNKGKTDNIEQQRRHRERKILGMAMNMFQAHKNKIDVNMNFTGVPEDNILMAPSVFKENPNNNILRKRGGNILDTSGYGNTLKFF